MAEKQAQIFASREIERLGGTKKKSAENGIIRQLVSMLDSQDYESMEAALFALLNVSFGSDRNKVRVAKAGAIPALLKKILQWQNTTLMELSLRALFILSSCFANKLEIASSGAIRILLELLDSRLISENCQSTSDRAKLDIVSTLHNLSTCPEIIPSILASGGLTTVSQLIYQLEKSSEVVEKALSLLESMVSLSGAALNQACEVSIMIPMLVEAVEEGSAACREHAAGVLLLICRSCRERFRSSILNEGAMVGLMQLSVEGTRVARAKAKALILLLRDRNNGYPSSSSSSSTRTVCWKNVAWEEAMRTIDGDERDGACIQMVEEMIAKLRT